MPRPRQTTTRTCPQHGRNRPARLSIDTRCGRLSVTLGRDLALLGGNPLSQPDPELMLLRILQTALA